MRSEYTVAVGDIVVQSYGGRTTREGTVVKVGSKRVYVGEIGGTTVAYQKDTQQRCDGNPGGFQTLEQVADRKLELEARGRLREHGINVNYPVAMGKLTWTTQQLVDLVAAVEQIHPHD